VRRKINPEGGAGFDRMTELSRMKNGAGAAPFDSILKNSVILKKSCLLITFCLRVIFTHGA
jgi:hypothetical protein